MKPPRDSIAIVPIVDRREHLIGVRLAGAAASASTLLAHVGAAGLDGLLVFADQTLAQLDDPALAELDPGGWIVQLIGEVAVPDKAATPDTLAAPEVAAVLAPHRARGLRFSVGNAAPGSSWLAHLSLFTHARLDVGSLPEAHLPRYVTALARRGVKTIAGDVSDRSRLAAAIAADIDAVEGHWFTTPPRDSSAAVPPLYGTVMRALALLRSDRDAAEVEQAIRADPALAFRLLRYVNSAAFAPRRELGSIEDAVAMLGQRALARWLGLSLVTAKVDRGAGAALALTAIMRARLMELLHAGAAPGATGDSGDAFMTGLFSALDAIVGQPIERIVASVDPPEPVARALLDREGELGAMLDLVLACENPVDREALAHADDADAPDAAASATDARDARTAKLHRSQLDALRWAMNELGQ